MNFGPSDDIQPVRLDTTVRFSSIGGLKEHIKCLREMIIFPLMYPELFKKFNTRPAKGVLFHGPPGTGKTLLARALANECALVGGRRVAFFMRKGADVMNKYYGESEKNLRMLFQTARKMKPSIIFFDEIDALAPIRRSQSDNHHASLVGTLLAEMDGVSDRGDVIVIGATNRPDAMDPAVRRAGRFDRELYFPPPEVEDRRDILDIYTRDWDPCLSEETLNHIARVTVGYLGSDIKALCSEAVLKAVRRVYPQIYESDCKLLINTQNVEVTADDMLAAMEGMIPAGARYTPQAARVLPHYTVPLLEDQLRAAARLLNQTFLRSSNRQKKTKSEPSSAPSVFLVTGECAETLLAPALLAQLQHCVVKELSVASLHAAHVLSPEQAVISLFAECRHGGCDSVIFVRDLQSVWNVLSRKNGAEILLQLWRVGSVGENTLLLATSNTSYQQLPKSLQEVFPVYKDCTYRVRKPTESEVKKFLTPVMTELPLVPPTFYQYIPPPPLPKAPTGPPENEQDVVRRLFREYDNLRVLRTSLRNIARSLSADRRFRMFTSHFEVEELPDYFQIVQNPMDLATMIAKNDNRQYYCGKEFLDDIDLICANAFLYEKAKPDKVDKKLRQEACALHAEAISKVADEIPTALELECQLIAKRRRENGGDVGEAEENGWNEDFYLSKLGVLEPKLDLDPPFKGSKMKGRRGQKRRALEYDMGPISKRCKRLHETIMMSMSNDIKQDRVEDGIVIRATKRNNFNFKRFDKGRSKPLNIVDRNCNIDPKDDDKSKPSLGAGGPKEVVIDKSELEQILRHNAKPLCDIGLEALIDLYAQLSKAVYRYSHTSDRTHLPHDLRAIVSRYVRCAKHGRNDGRQ